MKKRILDMPLCEGQAALFYLGQVGFLVKYHGKYLLIDPYLSDYVDRICSTEEVPWVRRYQPPILPEELDFADYIFCTHAHEDHTDPWTLKKIAAVNKKARFFGPKAVTDRLTGYGISKDAAVTLMPDEPLSLDQDITVTAIPAAHEELHPDGAGGYEEVGYLLKLGDLKLYHAGDCCPYPGLEDRVRGMDAMLLPINGRDYYRRYTMNIIGNFDCNEAVTLAKRTGAGLLVPMHFDLYDVNAVLPAVFVDCVSRIDPARAYHIFAPGEGYILSSRNPAQ